MVKNQKRKLVISLLCTLVFLSFDCSRTDAAYVYEEVEPYAYFYPQKIRCTCYYEHKKTCTGVMPYYGVVAGRKEWLGLTCELNEVNPDGSVGPFIGYFEFKDTGNGMDSDGDGIGDTIKNGTSIDVWVNTRAEAFEWVGRYGDYVYIKLIKAKG